MCPQWFFSPSGQGVGTLTGGGVSFCCKVDPKLGFPTRTGEKRIFFLKEKPIGRKTIMSIFFFMPPSLHPSIMKSMDK